MRKLLIVLLVAAVLVGADFAAARVFESKVATALERKYQLGTRPIVQVRDFPFLPHLLTGRFSALDLAATNARARGLDLDRVEVQLRGVRVPRTVLFGGHGLVRVDQVEGQVELSQAQINRLLAGRLSGGQVTIEANSVRLRVGTEVFGRLVDAVVTGRLGVRDGRLAFRPQSVQVGGVGDPALETTLVSRFTFDVPLPRLPADIQVERVDTEPGAVVLAGGASTFTHASTRSCEQRRLGWTRPRPPGFGDLLGFRGRYPSRDSGAGRPIGQSPRGSETVYAVGPPPFSRVAS